jgi:phosphoribosylformylglycinamidine synthase subunit PurL
MLLIVKRGREAEVERIFEKWDLHAVRIGEVTGDGRLRIKHHGQIVADVPNSALTDEAPLYRRPVEVPSNRAALATIPATELKPSPSARDTLLALLGSPTVASKRWIFQQYDYMVRTNTIALAGAGAAVVRVKGTNKALAMSVDGNGRFVLLDPRQGARLAIAEAARNVACAGGLPIGATNCLNFGNPERPEIMWQFAEAVAGLGDACRALDIPITGGNVSLYNETDGKSVLPTPVIGVVGVIEDASRLTLRAFPEAGLDIVQFGENLGELGGSEYLKTIHGLVRGVPPALDLGREKALQRLLVECSAARLIRSAHDCAEGGIAVTLAECCFENGGIGARIDVSRAAADGGIDITTATLFGESASRVIVSVEPAMASAVLAKAAELGIPAARIGTTGGAMIEIAIDGESAMLCSLAEAETRWESSLANLVAGRAAA